MDIWCQIEKLSPILVCFVGSFTSEFIRILIYIAFISHGIMFLSGGITNLSFLVASYFISQNEFESALSSAVYHLERFEKR